MTGMRKLLYEYYLINGGLSFQNFKYLSFLTFCNRAFRTPVILELRVHYNKNNNRRPARCTLRNRYYYYMNS